MNQHWLPGPDTSYRATDRRRAQSLGHHPVDHARPESTSFQPAELNTLVMIDTGRDVPAYFFISMLDPSQDYLRDVNRLISLIPRAAKARRWGAAGAA